MFKKEKNPRSKLRRMQWNYLLSVMALYCGVFIVLYLFATFAFMLFEVGVYWHLLIDVLLLVLTLLITNHYINHVYLYRFYRTKDTEEPTPVERNVKKG